MAISFPITLPSLPTRTVSFRPKSVVAVSQSPTSLLMQAQVSSGQQWLGSVRLAPMKRATAEPIIAALVSLNGLEGSFLIGDNANKLPRGLATGTPLVNGAGQTGAELNTDGWAPNKTGILKAGDWLQLGSGSSSRLYKVLVDADSNASGQATLTLWPKLRSSPADNAVIVVNNPVGKFMLAQEYEWSIDEAHTYGLDFEIMEDLRS